MKSDQTASANGRTAVSSDGLGPPAAEGLQAKCRRQAIVIDRLGAWNLVATSIDGGATFGQPVDLNSFDRPSIQAGGKSYQLYMRTGFGAPTGDLVVAERAVREVEEIRSRESLRHRNPCTRGEDDWGRHPLSLRW